MRETVLELKDISKVYPGVLALDKVTIKVRRGEVHAIVGENGAGKSTLVKIVAGAERMDGGEIYIKERRVEIIDPHHAQTLGIGVIYQELNLVPELSIAENIFLGREPQRNLIRFIDWRRLIKDSENLLQELGIGLDPNSRIRELSIAERQMVEVAKALSMNAELLIMDEPSATLTERELEGLFRVIRELKGKGVTVIYISHRLEEIFEIADMVTVLRDGNLVGSRRVKDIVRSELVRMMVGRNIREEFPSRRVELGGELLRIEGISSDERLKEINFSLRKGEILGIAGLVGSGRTELARAIFGADRFDKGRIYLEGEKIRINSCSEGIRHGLALLTEDRREQGLTLEMSVNDNITIINLEMLCSLGFINHRREKEAVENFIEELQIKTPSIRQLVKNLSGGNQQKVVLAKWLFTNSKVIIFDEPTRGIDVGAKHEIYQLMNRLVEKGIGIIMISSELPEILGMCDRVLVMREGRTVGEFSREEATQERIMMLATGG